MRTIFTDPSWYNGYINSLIYVAINVALSLGVALPAAYAFSRYRFIGDKHMFFWLLTNRMAPPAVFLLPFFQLYQTIGLFDTHIAVALAHCLFNVPLAVWILEGFMSGVPKEIDETAYLDGYSLPALLLQDLPAADQVGRRRHRLLLLHVQLGRAAAGAHADDGERQADRRHHDPHGLGRRHGLGHAGGGRRADHRAGCPRDLVRAQLHRQGLCPRAGVRTGAWTVGLARAARPSWSSSMYWTTPTAIFFAAILLMLADHDGLGARLADGRAARLPADDRRPAATGCSSACWAPPGSTSAGWASATCRCGGRRSSALVWFVARDALRLRRRARHTGRATPPPGRTTAAGNAAVEGVDRET